MQSDSHHSSVSLSRKWYFGVRRNRYAYSCSGSFDSKVTSHPKKGSPTSSTNTEGKMSFKAGSTTLTTCLGAEGTVMRLCGRSNRSDDSTRRAGRGLSFVSADLSMSLSKYKKKDRVVARVGVASRVVPDCLLLRDLVLFVCEGASTF